MSLENKTIVERAREYKPNNSGSNNLAKIIVNNKEPTFAVKVVIN